MKYLLILIACLAYSSALVHYQKLQKGANGCKTEGDKSVEIKVGEYVQDEKTCGVWQCQNKEGDALVYYCQRPATYMNCQENGVSTTIDFPQCCWECVRYVLCNPDGSPVSKDESNKQKGNEGTASNDEANKQKGNEGTASNDEANKQKGNEGTASNDEANKQKGNEGTASNDEANKQKGNEGTASNDESK